jgi:hypothetical protein
MGGIKMENTDEQTLINPYPKEYGYLRIGTPVNMDFNKALYGYKAFDMTKLANKGYLRKIFKAAALTKNRKKLLVWV